MIANGLFADGKNPAGVTGVVSSGGVKELREVVGRSRVKGLWGEQVAASYLQRAGWALIARNYRAGRNEIDLVVRRGGTVAFVEVKTRSTKGFGHPLGAITATKRRSIQQVAEDWVRRYGDERLTYRFDAIGVTPGIRTGEPLLEHVEGAWGV